MSQAVAQDLEQLLLHRELVKKHHVQNDPPDGKEPVGCAVTGSRQAHRRRHAINEHGNGEGDGKAQRRRDVNPDS
jgi:hypothetical protein